MHSALGTPRMKDHVVLIAGFMADARIFMPQIVRFGLDRPVTIFTLGMGETVEKLAVEIAPLLPARAAVVGHGLGGNVAIELLRRRPEAISRIALISTDPLPEPVQQVAAEEALVVAAKTGHLADCIAQLIPETALYDAPWRGEVMALVQDMAATLGLDQFMRQLRAMQRRPDQQKTLRKTDVPTLILTGAHDRIVPPRRAEFLAGLMPQGCLEIIPEAGYLPQLEQPDAVTKVLETFLSGRLPTLLLR